MLENKKEKKFVWKFKERKNFENIIENRGPLLKEKEEVL